jgi:hypothetical protein
MRPLASLIGPGLLPRRAIAPSSVARPIMVIVVFFSKMGSFLLTDPTSVFVFALKDAIFNRECTATVLQPG